ncbi:class I SAM-dependent methyltransferase [Haloarcula argentinensis]|nr:class I SAM-dependent methyltransferase [Haloarcula argentinensis]
MNKRNLCPVCETQSGNSKFSVPYDSSKVKDFFDEFFGERQGIENRVDMSYFEGESLVIRYCAHCHFYWHENILGPDGMEKLYEEWIDAEFSKQRRDDWDRRGRMLEKTFYPPDFFKGVKPPGELRVLDIGMGWGGYLQAMNYWGAETHGVELSEIRRKHVSRNGVDVHESVEDVTGEFDVIALHQTLEHLPDPNKTMVSVGELLQKDGLVHIEVPRIREDPTKENVLKKSGFNPPAHINGFTRDSMLELTKKHGLSPISPTPLFRKNVGEYGIKRKLRRILNITGTLWIYDRFAGEQPMPRFFTLEQ